MPENVMLYLIESSERRGSVGRSLTSFATSFLLQSLVGSFLILAPLMATGTLPSPHRIASFMTAPTLKVTPPRTPAPVRPRRITATLPVRFGELVAPMATPDEIGEDIDFFETMEQPPVGTVDVLGQLIRAPSGPPEPLKIQEPVRIGGHIQPPRRTTYLAPVYPEVALKARVQGMVILEAVIDSEGNVTNVRVLRSVPLLDRAAIEAVREWKYEPTLLNGVPVPIIMTLTVHFSLD